MPPDTRIKDVAQQILDTLATELANEGISVPTRQYIHSGEIAHDLDAENCAEALIVSWTGSFQGTAVPATGQATILQLIIKCMAPVTARFTIVLLRCVPTLDDELRSPSSSSLQVSGEEILTDAMTLPRIVIDQQMAGTLHNTRSKLVGISNVLPIGPRGMVGGTQLDLFVTVLT